MLFLVPATSWYYLQSGYKRFQKSMESLKDYGALPAFELESHRGKKISDKDLEGKLCVFAFVDKSDEKVKMLIKNLSLMTTQFEERKDAVFLLTILDYNSEYSKTLATQLQQNQLTDKEQFHILRGKKQDVGDLAGKGFKVPDLNSRKGEDTTYTLESRENISDYPYLVLVDTKGRIRNYYPAYEQEAVNLLVEQIALILPKYVEEDPVLKRETEK